MTRSKHLAPALLVSVLLGGPALSPAHAARYVFTLTENPCGMDPNCTPSVTGTGSGNINTDGLTFLANDYVDNVIVPTTASIIVGPGPRGRANVFGGPISPPPSFGTGQPLSASMVNGVTIGVTQGRHNTGVFYVMVPIYGQPTDTSFTLNGGFDTLGLTKGTYVWTWGGGDEQSITLLVGTTLGGAVPEPASWAMLIAGFGTVGLAARRRRGSQRPTADRQSA